MKKTTFNRVSDLRYVSPQIQTCQLAPETCIMAASTSGDTEDYKVEQLPDDLWM